jgi:hypothetical protein
MHSKRLKVRSLAAFLACVACEIGVGPEVAAQNRDGTRLDVDAAEITINGRVQMQLNTSSVDEEAPTEMLLRRVRFGAVVRINDFVGGRVQPELSGQRIGLADAYMDLTFSRGLVFLAGKAHRPFGIMEQTTSNQILPIERGLRIRGLDDFELSSILSTLGYSDRDVGLQLRGSPRDVPLGMSYAVGVFAGPLHGSVGDDFTQQYVARLALSPIDDARFAVAWSRRDFIGDIPGEADDLEPGDAFLADFEYGGPTPEPGLHLVAEAAAGDFDPFLDQEFVGAQGWLGYRLRAGRRVTLVEPLIRVSHASIDTPEGTSELGGTLVTPGLNLYLGGLNRILLNYDVWQGEDGRDENSFKAQFQMVF